ncbi:3-beta hydroxysteroid dehydrogenase isomerase family [Salix suchowensis]|nr:3-beta hydroxysteroid dehydrogenase isomerase family [Salix suchowensis]
MFALGGTILIAVLIWCYIQRNDKALKAQPDKEFAAFSPNRVTAKQVLTTAAESLDKLTVADNYLQEQAAGPRRHDLLTGSAKDIDFIQLDISDKSAVYAAFTKSWPDESHDDVTIFHTASNIRFYERHPALLHRSAKVNVRGTENIIDAAKAIGANILLYTSSGSVAILAMAMGEQDPFHFQVIDDDEHNHILPRRHKQFFSNYAATKMHAETLVRKADKTGQLRTGCLRPGNGIFGPGGDMLCGAYLVRKANPTWVQNTLQSFVYVENCALAHLCYEQRLIELSNGSCNPDIGGQVFHIADPGAPPTYGDVYTTLEVLTDGETYFPEFSPTVMLFIAHMIELYYLVQYYLSESTSSILRAFGRFLPTINGI